MREKFFFPSPHLPIPPLFFFLGKGELVRWFGCEYLLLLLKRAWRGEGAILDLAHIFKYVCMYILPSLVHIIRPAASIFDQPEKVAHLFFVEIRENNHHQKR